MFIEQWKPLKNYEGLYEVSNSGNIASMPRMWSVCRGKIKFNKGRTLLSLNGRSGRGGYPSVCLRKDGRSITKTVHLLVWDMFGDKPRNGKKLQVDHIDENKLNNRIDNLQLLNGRGNVSKSILLRDKTSKYIGVSYCSQTNKWRAKIRIGSISKCLGRYITESQAALAYQKKLIQIGRG